MSDELHIASLVVYTAPARRAAIDAAIRRMPDARVHASTTSGKLVVTLETLSSDAMSAHVNTIRGIKGVLSAVLVFQCADSLEAMNEEMP